MSGSLRHTSKAQGKADGREFGTAAFWVTFGIHVAGLTALVKRCDKTQFLLTFTEAVI